MVPRTPPIAPTAAKICLGDLSFVCEVSGVSWYVWEVSRMCLEVSVGGGSWETEWKVRCRLGLGVVVVVVTGYESFAKIS